MYYQNIKWIPFYWKKHFHKNPLYFRIIADIEADNEKDGSKKVNKTTNICKQKPVLIGYYIISELEDVSKSGYYESPLGYNNADWFVKEVIKLESKMAFYLEIIILYHLHFLILVITIAICFLKDWLI